VFSEIITIRNLEENEIPVFPIKISNETHFVLNINTSFHQQTLLMTQEIQRSFRELLNKITWIDDETKYLATEKVNAMSLKIGYPDFILQPYLLNQRYKDVMKCFHTIRIS